MKTKKKPKPQIVEIIPFSGYIWRVLDVQNNQALILSELVLKSHAYNEQNIGITWEKCTLRYYLNNYFYNKLSDKNKIVERTISNKNNQWYGTAGGNDTTDHIFLLSLEELVQYFGDSGQLRRNWQLTGDVSEWYFDDEFNEKRIAKDANGAPAWWWLRSPGCNSDVAATVFMDGGVCVGNNGGSVSAVGGVRPALWLNM